MSKSTTRLPLARAANLAERIITDLSAVSEPGRCIAAGSLRRLRPDVGDIELVVIPRFAASLLPDVPGASLLELELAAWAGQGRLLPAGPNRGAALKKYYIPALGCGFKLEINISDPQRWPVELAIKTGSAEFSHKLVTHRAHGGYLPGHCRIGNGWQVWEGGYRRGFAEEREFIEWICGKWIEPVDRD
jgi:DNA polymerase/3'-5' exonuclease PolX